MDTKRKNGEDPGENFYEYGAYGCAGITVGYLVMICVMYKKIRMAIKIMETSADFVTEVMLIVLVPPIITILLACWFVFWLVTMIYVYCQGEFK